MLELMEAVMKATPAESHHLSKRISGHPNELGPLMVKPINGKNNPQPSRVFTINRNLRFPFYLFERTSFKFNCDVNDRVFRVDFAVVALY
jgi:hypothetical protein